MARPETAGSTAGQGLAVLEALTAVPWPTLATVVFLTLGLLLGVVKAAAGAITAIRGMDPEKRGDLGENALVGFFVFVTGGLIMQGLIGFARTDMGLGGIWPYLFFFALDGMAAYFAVVAYRWSKKGATATGPRLMVFAIVTGSAWFQWEHADGKTAAARVAWSVMPLIAAVLWETILITRRKSWRMKQPTTGTPVPRARWVWDPAGSAAITRRMQLWNVPHWEAALELHMIRVESIRRLRRAYGWFWFWRVPADVAVRLRQGFRIREAAARVDALVAAREQRLVVDPVGEVFSALTPPTVRPGAVVPLPGTAVVVSAPAAHVRPAAENPPGPDVPVAPHRPAPARPVPPVQDQPIVYRPAPATGTPEFKRAVDDYRFSVLIGNPMSGRKVCKDAHVDPNNRRFAQRVIAAAQQQPAPVA